MALFMLSFICTLIISLPLAITNTILGAIHPGECDYTDSIGLNAAQWLLGLGISSIVTSVILIVCFTVVLLKIKYCVPIGVLGSLIITIFNILFGTIWFVIGTVVLLHGNIECIRNGSSHVIYALVLLCISALQIAMECLKGKEICQQ
jgi:hypothetical protein